MVEAGKFQFSHEPTTLHKLILTTEDLQAKPAGAPPKSLADGRVGLFRGHRVDPGHLKLQTQEDDAKNASNTWCLHGQT